MQRQTSNFCRDCDYDIRDLADEDACPECVLPASVSRSEDRIRTFGAAFLRRTSRTMAVMALADFAFAGCIVAGLLFPVAVPITLVPMLGISIIACWMLTRGAAAWMLTRIPTRRSDGAAGAARLSAMVRLSHLGLLLVALPAIVVLALSGWQGTPLDSVIFAAALLATGVSYIALTRFLAWLARENRDRTLMKHATSIRSMAMLALFGGDLIYLFAAAIMHSPIARWALNHRQSLNLALGAMILLFVVLLLYEAVALMRWAIRANTMARRH